MAEKADTKEVTTIYDQYLDKKHAFFLSQLVETGLSLEMNWFPYEREGRSTESRYMFPDKDGNVCFHVPDIITGDLETYLKGEPPHQKIRDWYLTRWENPKITKDGPAKYTPPKGEGTRVLFTPPVVNAFRDKKKIETLYLVEGYKKAIAGWLAGELPIVGMNGLYGFKVPGGDSRRLRKEIKEVLTTCKVQRVVIIYDNDLFNLSNNKDNPETKRPNDFFNAALTAKALFEPFADVYLSYPTPEPEKLGLDDLLLKHRNFSKINSPVDIKPAKDAVKLNFPDGEKKIIKDLVNSVKNNQSGKFFDLHKISAMSDYKVRELFHLTNAQAFYEYYGQVIRERSKEGKFRFYKYWYEIQPDGTIQKSDDQDTRSLGIDFIKNKTYRDKEKKGFTEIANFVMEVLFQIDSEIEPIRICRITNFEGQTKIIEITSKTFVSETEFSALMLDQGNYIWSGNKDDMRALMTILFRVEKPAEQINQLGWQDDDRFYAFANGIVTPSGFLPVDENGILTHADKNYYLPAYSKFNARKKSLYKDTRRFAHVPAQKPVTFEQWKRQFSTVYGNNGEIAACFYISALYSDIIFEHKSGIGFPLLWAAGKPKTGKSTIAESLLYMFGKKSDAIGLAGKSTIKYFITRFAQIVNGLVHLDEYSNTKVNKDVKETIKNIFDRIGYGRRNFSNDYNTTNTPILSAAVVSGEEIPTENHALFTRAILMMFNKTSDKRTTKEKEEFKKLARMEEDGLTNITVELVRYRQLIEDNFTAVFDEVYGLMTDHYKTIETDDRVLKSCAWIITPVRILEKEGKIDFQIQFEELLKVFYHNIDQQVGLMKGNTDVSKFWDIVDILINRRELTKAHGDYKIENDAVVIRLNRFHQAYSVAARKLGYEKILDKSTLGNYLESEFYFIEKKKARFAGSTPAMAYYLQKSEIEVSFDETQDDDDLPGADGGPRTRTEPEPEEVDGENIKDLQTKVNF